MKHGGGRPLELGIPTRSKPRGMSRRVRTLTTNGFEPLISSSRAWRGGGWRVGARAEPMPLLGLLCGPTAYWTTFNRDEAYLVVHLLLI